MVTGIFVNVAVKELEKSKSFVEALGWKINAQFTDETAASVVIGENIYAMLLTEAKMKQFTTKQLADAHNTTEVLLALGVESRQQVDELVNKAVAAGGKEYGKTQEYGFMYGRDFEDPDGHIWEVFWMDPNHVQE